MHKGLQGTQAALPLPMMQARDSQQEGRGCATPLPASLPGQVLILAVHQCCSVCLLSQGALQGGSQGERSWLCFSHTGDHSHN